MDETKIHSGTRIKLKKLPETALPQDFLTPLREFAHGKTVIQAVFLFSLQKENQNPQACMAIALKSGFFSSGNEEFLNIVDEVQLLLPEDLSLNLYRFETSDMLASYCAHSVEPLYLRSSAWLEKQRKKYQQDTH
jgi:hypothetical protein